MIIYKKKYQILIGSKQCSSKVAQCKLYMIILDYDLLKDNGKFSEPMICINR